MNINLFFFSIAIFFISFLVKKGAILMLTYMYELQPKGWYWQNIYFEIVSVILNSVIFNQRLIVDLVCFLTTSFILSLIVLSFIDIEYFILPDCIVIPLWLTGLMANSYLEVLTGFYSTYISGLLAWFLLRLCADFYHVLAGRSGLGEGDIKLFGVLGSWFGLAALPLILWIASFSALIYILIKYFLTQKSYKAPIPFGPFLSGSAWIYLVWLT